MRIVLVAPLAEAVPPLECVDHPGLPEPVAFVAGIHLPPLLRQASRPALAREILAAWSSSVAPSLAFSLLGWAWRHEILKSVR